MKEKYILRILLSAAIFLMASARTTNAQPPEQQMLESLRSSANHAIQGTMDALRERTDDLNKRIEHINEIRPLDPKNLDSAHVVLSISEALQFIEYLKGYQTFSDSLSRAFEDSLFAVNASMPPGVEEKALAAFGESFAADRKAFDSYIGSLSKVYSEVLDVLGFLQNTRYRVVKQGLEFPAPEDVPKYKKMMQSIDATSTELRKASEESKKATAWANKKIAEINDARGATSNVKEKAVKKKSAKK